jgi:uncharacterized membrane protein HdeD (DUF308 family)
MVQGGSTLFQSRLLRKMGYHYLTGRIMGIVMLVLGILIAVKGVIALIDALRGRGNAITVVFAALTIAIGVFLAFGNAAAWIVIVCGVLLAVDGVIGLIGSLKK